MEKFDQPELHPRGFPLWMEILLVSALILTPIVAVALYQAWQDSQHKQEDATNTRTAPDNTSESVKNETAPITETTIEENRKNPDENLPAK